MSRIQWISYTNQEGAGCRVDDVKYHESLSKARDAYVQYCDDVGVNTCYMRLYFVPDGIDGIDMMASAEEFRDIGCPFDYPDMVVERGPRGGVVVNRA